MVECTLFITHCLRLNLQLHTIDLVRTCRIVVSALLRGNWQDFNWHDASRGASAIAELLVVDSFKNMTWVTSVSNYSEFIEKQRKKTCNCVQFLPGQRPVMSFSHGAVTAIAIWKSAPVAVVVGFYCDCLWIQAVSEADKDISRSHCESYKTCLKCSECTSDFQTSMLESSALLDNFSVSDRGAEYCDARVSLCVCVFVCPRSYIRNYMSNFQHFFVYIAMARSSSGSIVIRFVFPFLLMTSYLLISQVCSTSLPSWSAVLMQPWVWL